jgi:recombinational DNA repair protein (RecF pathway)
LRVFELALLGKLGFAPVLQECAVCGRDDLSVRDTIDVRLIPDRGGVVCLACAGRGRPMRPVVRLALGELSRAPLADALSIPLAADVARGCREALHELIAIHLSAPLRSLEFMAKLGTMEQPPPAPIQGQATEQAKEQEGKP